MYSPNFSYTDRLVKNLIQLEASKVNTANINLGKEVQKKLILNSKSTSLFHIARMLDINLSLGESSKIIHGTKKLDDIEEEKDKLLMNYKRLLEFVGTVEFDSFPELNKSLITTISKILLGNLKEPWLAEEYRNFNDKIDERWDNFLRLRDESIIGQQVEGEMHELIDWHNSVMANTAVVVRIAIVYFRLIEIAPFICANKFIALGVINSMFYKSGLSHKTYMSIESAIDQNEDIILKSYVSSKQANDLTHWIESFCEIILKTQRAVRENMSEFIEADEKSKEQPFLDLNKRQLKVLKYLQKVPFIKREDYCQMLEVSTMTAYRDLSELVNKKLVRIEGQGRGTKYKLTIN